MSAVNRVFLLGFVGESIEYTEYPDGLLCMFSLCTEEERQKASGEYQTTLQWHRVQAWNEWAQVCKEKVKRGTQLFLVGSIQTRSWIDEANNKKYVTEVVVEKIEVL